MGPHYIDWRIYVARGQRGPEQTTVSGSAPGAWRPGDSLGLPRPCPVSVDRVAPSRQMWLFSSAGGGALVGMVGRTVQNAGTQYQQSQGPSNRLSPTQEQHR